MLKTLSFNLEPYKEPRKTKSLAQLGQAYYNTAMKRELSMFFAALTFFTRLPAPPGIPFNQEALGRAARYFPAVGIVVGGLGALVFWLAHWVLPHNIAILLSLITTVLVTGAFHEDGLADTCDAFGGGWTKPQILQIMKDSRLGTYGVIGLGLVLALKFASLTHFPAYMLPPLLIVGHSLSRFAAATVMYTHPYVRPAEHSKSKAATQAMPPSDLMVAALCGILPIFLLGPLYFVIVMVPVFLVRQSLSWYFTRHLGGYTGDCLGAIQQLTEVTCYVTLLLLL